MKPREYVIHDNLFTITKPTLQDNEQDTNNYDRNTPD